MNLNIIWYAHPDDLIGGWCIMSCDKPPSQVSPLGGSGEYMIASFMDEDDAKYIVALHNIVLRRK